MNLTIGNKYITLKIDTLGAQMRSLQSADGTEYLWQGDPAYWDGQAPNLFPFIGRLYEGKCSYEGKEFPMGIHGFAAAQEFEPVITEPDRVILELRDNEQTRKQYPVFFSYQIGYTLKENQVIITNRARNLDQKCMAFAIGGHPGFRVPIEPGEKFEDYSLQFAHDCVPTRIGFSDQVLVNGQQWVYRLKDNRTIPLSHDIFDDDAIILRDVDRKVKLSSSASTRSVTVEYPDFPCLGFWHMPHMDAPYVCIEPWTSLPARQDVVEELTQKSDLIHLNPGETFQTNWTVSVT